MNISAALPTFIITLREGFEAALVVGIVAACLRKANQTQLYRWVWAGIITGIAASVLVGLVLISVLGNLATAQAWYAPLLKQFLEAGLGIVAIAMLSWMLIWMSRQAKSLKAEVEGTIHTALAQNQGAAAAVFTLILVAVVREGFETVIFITAQFQEGWQITSLGAIAGLSVAILLGFLLFKWGVRINVGLFFQVMGILLLLIVGGLLVGALQHLDQAIALLSQLQFSENNLCFSSNSCILGFPIWNLADVLPEREFPGIVFKSLFGYRDHLYLIQGCSYLLFLTIIGRIYFQSLENKLATKK